MSVSRFLVVLFFGLTSSFVNAQQVSSDAFAFKDGDLLFQELSCGPLCEAIVRVTQSWENRKFNHMGMVYTQGDSLMVLEAIGEDVHLTPLNEFLSRSLSPDGDPLVVVGRLKENYEKLIPAALIVGLGQLGLPYDTEFIYDNEAYYCSELIYDAFKEANNGEEVFTLNPMTFKDPESGQTFSVWEEYYAKLQMEVPEGLPGCNPGGLSLSDKLDIVYVY